MNKIKYLTDPSSSIIYTEWYRINPNFIIRGIINTKTFTYQIYEFDTEVSMSGKASSLGLAKKALRTQLIKAGAVFNKDYV